MSFHLTPAHYPQAEEVDILLLLEGTFPFVSGGVASWTYRFIKLMTQYRFGVIFVGSRKEDYQEFKYPLPDNVVHFEAHYLFGDEELMPKACHGNPTAYQQSRDIHQQLRDKVACCDLILDSKFYTDSSEGIDLHSFLYGKLSWQYMTDMYDTYCHDPSFIDYFWTVRAMHTPLWVLARIANSAPKAKLYHSLSTGYAGFLGAMLNHSCKVPLLISEHGIYTKERRIDLLHSEWLQGSLHALQHNITEVSYFRKLWIRFFESLARVSYESAQAITCLFAEAKPYQIECGAHEHKIKVIPNGVDIIHYQNIFSKRPSMPPAVICLLGRVVAIKNIKMFIRAMATIKKHIPEVQGWIAGPKDVELEYTAECEHLVKHLGLTSVVKFLGPQNVSELLPKIGLLVLSSISEGLPLVILEAFAAGVPVVSTDVGGCKQLIEGGVDEADCALGHAGAIVPIANPQALATESLKLLQDHACWSRAQSVALQRVRQYYDEIDINRRYDTIYCQLMSAKNKRD